jgi:hypothetical protein
MSIETTVRNAILAAQQPAWTKRCEKWRQLHELLQELHREATYSCALYTHPETVKTWAEGDGAGFLYVPIVRMYAERLSVAFDQPPQTYLRRRGSTDRLEETDPQVVQWRQDVRDIKFAATMQQVEELTTVLGQSVVSPTWVGDRIRWRVYSPYEVAIGKSPADPDEFTSAEVIAIQIRTADGEAAQSDWLVWTRQGQTWGSALYDYGGRLKSSPLFEAGANGYGRHPLVLWQWRTPPNGEVFVEPDEALLQLARKTNVAVTDLSHGVTLQIHAQPVMWGQPDGIQDGAVSVGPDRVLRFNGRRETGDFEFRTPATNIEKLIATINYWLQTFAITRGLPPDTFLADSSTRNLGAKQQEEAELQRLRMRRYPLIMDSMRETFEVHKAVGNYWSRHGGNRIAYDEDIELEVELAPVRRVEDRQAKTQADAAEIERGQTSTITLVQQERGITRAEAEAEVARNRADEGAAAPATDGP